MARRRLNSFKQNLKQVAERGEQALDSERARLVRQYDIIKSEVQTYENNLGFLNAKSKSGNGLVALMQSKMDELKAEIEELKKRIDAGEK